MYYKEDPTVHTVVGLDVDCCAPDDRAVRCGRAGCRARRKGLGRGALGSPPPPRPDKNSPPTPAKSTPTETPAEAPASPPACKDTVAVRSAADTRSPLNAHIDTHCRRSTLTQSTPTLTTATAHSQNIQKIISFQQTLSHKHTPPPTEE